MNESKHKHIPKSVNLESPKNIKQYRKDLLEFTKI